MTTNDILIGTSGYDYPEWKGAFYPEDLKRKDFLAYQGVELVHDNVDIITTYTMALACDTLTLVCSGYGVEFTALSLMFYTIEVSCDGIHSCRITY